MGTLVVSLALVAVVSAIIVSMIKNKKKGRHSCGGNCGSCGLCHKGEVSPAAATSFPPAPSADSNAVRNACSITLEIDGMMCGMCESHINDAVRNNFSVKSVKSNHKTGTCRIVSSTALDMEKLKSVIEQTGYKVKQTIA